VRKQITTHDLCVTQKLFGKTFNVHECLSKHTQGKELLSKLQEENNIQPDDIHCELMRIKNEEEELQRKINEGEAKSQNQIQNCCIS
jgi:hypothetical protein